MLREINKPFLLLVASIFLQSFSLLSIKISTLQTDLLAFVLLVVAFGFIGLRTVCWQYLLESEDLSRVYPYASLVQVLILLYAAIIFNEPVTLFNIIGLLMMLGGIFYISR
ncbi:MAG: EamA family transporter [Thiotrichaceae bacterium]|nr:EamA family transporter [Thiotrichaceae bacterium]